MDKQRCYILITFVILLLVYFLRLKAKLEFDFKAGQRVRIKTRLSQEPVIKDNKQLFKLRGVCCQTSRFPLFHYGDFLITTGTIQQQLINPYFSQFWLINPQIVKLKADNQKLPWLKQFLAALMAVRRGWQKTFDQLLPGPQASLLAGLVLGIPGRVSADFYQALKTTGTLHVVVASGMNIALTAGSLVEVLAPFLRRKRAVVVSSLVVWLYCFIVGFNPPIVRAGLMASLAYLAVLAGREARGWWSLGLVALFMLLINPLLIFDVGFQLSFTATLGLLTLGSFLNDFFSRFLPVISGDLAETASALIFSLPVLVITFGQFNPLTLIPNGLLLWLVPYLMVLGILIGLVGFVFMPLARVLSWLAFLPLTFFIALIRFFSQWQFLNL